MDLVQLLGAALGLAAGLGLWFWRRRRAEHLPGPRASRPLMSLSGRDARGPGRVLHEVAVQGPHLKEIEGGRYEIGDNSASRGEIEEFMASSHVPRPR